MNHVQNMFAVPIYKVRILPSDVERDSFDILLTNMFAQMPTNSWALETGKSTGSHNLNLHWFDQTRWLVNAMIPHVANFWEHLDYRHDTSVTITASWANEHLKGDFTGEHTHCGGAEQSHISAVYYFKKPVNSGHIEFADPLDFIKRMTPIHHYSELDSYIEVPAEQYDLILFPSWLKHRTQKNNSDESRVAVSMNFVGAW